MKRTILLTLSVLMLVILALTAISCNKEHECDWGEWQTVEGKAASCTKAGEEIRTCKKDASHTETRTVKMLAHQFSTPATLKATRRCTVCESDVAPKIIIIGNSHSYYGGMVKAVSQDKMTLSDRRHDDGYFYQLCRANGVNAEVVNWTFGNHSLKDLFSGDCQANRACGNGTDHLKHLTDNNFDFVIFQNGSTHGDEIEKWIDFLMNFFKEGNKDTKFIMLVQAKAHNDRAADATKYTWLSDLDVIEQKGVTIVDWGKLVFDLYSGAATLPGAGTLPLNQNSFVIAKSEADGYHPSLLAGYVTSLMAYCAITGDSAVGQAYDFCSTTRDFSAYLSSYYKVGSTNFPQVFNSTATMTGLQQTIDTYLAQKAYKNY